jgi:hypothetical protein
MEMKAGGVDLPALEAQPNRHSQLGILAYILGHKDAPVGSGMVTPDDG